VNVVLRRGTRAALRAWARTGRASGWFYRTVEHLGPALAEATPIATVLPNGCRVSCDLRDHVQRQIFFFGVYEPVLASLFVRLLRPGMTVVDGGANVGQYTLLAAFGVGATGSVHSFEPVPHTFERLTAHVRANGLTNVHANRVALWNESTELTLGLADDQENNAGAYSAGVRDSTSSFTASAIRLDDYCAQRDITRVHLVKLDVEGAELQALHGMQQILERDRPVVFVEVCRETASRFGYDHAETWKYLVDGLGYAAWVVRDGELQSVQHDEVREQENVLFAVEAPAIDAHVLAPRGALRWAASGHD